VRVGDALVERAVLIKCEVTSLTIDLEDLFFRLLDLFIIGLEAQPGELILRLLLLLGDHCSQVLGFGFSLHDGPNLHNRVLQLDSLLVLL